MLCVRALAVFLGLLWVVSGWQLFAVVWANFSSTVVDSRQGGLPVLQQQWHVNTC
jgi:hypothetical protein